MLRYVRLTHAGVASFLLVRCHPLQIAHGYKPRGTFDPGFALLRTLVRVAADAYSADGNPRGSFDMSIL